MQLNGNILIIGDSFCYNHHGWPLLLLDKIQHAEHHIDSLPGAGWWAIRQRLLLQKENDLFFKNTQLLIYIHTQKDRVFSRNPEIYTASNIELPLRFSNKDFDEPTLAVSLYYKYLHDLAFTPWAEEQWVTEFSNIVANIPLVINLFFDAPSPELIARAPGCVVNTGLLDLVLTQYDSHENLLDDGLRGFLNHFSPYNNQVFADQLYNIIQGNASDFKKLEFMRE